MTRLDAHTLLDRLLGPARPEVSCDECFAALDSYVEMELAGRDPELTLSGMRAHLQGCMACAEDHESLRAFIRAADVRGLR